MFTPCSLVGSSSLPRLTCLVPLFCTGVTMKLMDEVAGIVAARHCKTNIVTASVDAINFHDKIRKGNSALPTGRVPAAAWGPGAISFWFTPGWPCPGVCLFATGSRRPGSRSVLGRQLKLRVR